jgi:hypothetical protein
MPIIKRSPDTDMPEPTLFAANNSGIDLPTSMTEAHLTELDGVNTTDVTDTMDVSIPTNATIEIETTLSDAQLDLSIEDDMSSNNDTASTVEINNPVEPVLLNTTDLGITEATTLPNDIIDFTAGVREGRNLDAFPNILASILKNDPVAYIAQYKLSINKFADAMVFHQQQYGLSEDLFEPLCKIGEAFAVFYDKNSQKQNLVKSYFKFISDHRNFSDTSPINCSDTTHFNTKLTTPISTHSETTFSTEYTTEAYSLSNQTTLATTEFTPQSISPTIITTQNSPLDETFHVTNTTANATEINPSVTTTTLDNHLVNLGLVSMGNGLVAGFIDGVAKSMRLSNPIVKIAAQVVSATALATLPVMLSTVKDDESEQSNSLNKILAATAYSLGSSLILSGVSFAAQRGYSYFNKKPMNKDSIASKALEALPLLANTSFLINGGYNLTEATVIVGTNVVGAGVSSALTQSLWSFARNKIKNNNHQAKDVEKGFANNNNNLEMNLVKTNNAAFEEDNFNLDSQFQILVSEAFNSKDKDTSKLDAFLNASDKMKFFGDKGDIKTQAFFMKNLILLAMQNPKLGLHAYNHLQSQERLLPTNKNLEENCSVIPFTPNEKIATYDAINSIDTNTLKKLLGSFISGLKLNTKDFKFESKIFTQNKYSFERINIFYGINKVLSIFTPAIEQDSTSHKLLFPAINKLVESLSNKKSIGNDTYSKFLFVLPNKSETAVIEIVTFASSPKSSGEITIYNSDDSFKKEFQALSNIAKIYKYGYKLEKNDPKSTHLLTSYYFIKNSVKNYLKDCLLPDNASPDFLEGLLATFIYKLKLTGLEFETEKVNPTENNETSALAKKPIAPKNSKKTEETIDLKNECLVNTIDRKRNNAIAVCLSTKTLSIFKAVRPDNNANRTEVIDRLLSKRKLEIQNNAIKKDLLPFADGKGIAIIEIITSKLSESKLIIHDLLGVLADIHTKIVAIADKNGYQYVYNPNKDYSSDWQSKERCQLAAYNFIRKTALDHLDLSNQINAEMIHHDKNLPAIVLGEVKHNLSIKNEYDMDSLHEIKRCDGGVFNLRTYIADVSNYLKTLSIETTPLLTNKSHLRQIIATEIQRNLSLADRHNLLASSELEVITWNGVRLENWPELFSTKEVTLLDSETGKVCYLIKFSSDFMLIQGKMAVLAKQENNEHPLISDIRNFLVYELTNKPGIKIVKQHLWLNSLRELFSESAAKENTPHETKVSSNHASFFRPSEKVEPNLPAVAPVHSNHSMPVCK